VVVTILKAVLPSAGALFFFVLGVRALFQADRRERAAAARFERAQTGGRDPARHATSPDSGDR
jgi:hypothetical protein